MGFEKRILAMASIGAHSNYEGRGFRKRDIRFLAELLTNWTDVFTKPDSPKWHNTQAMRYVSELIQRGLAKQSHIKSSKSNSSKLYSLTRLGLLELVNELVGIEGYANIKDTMTIYYFLSAYHKRIVQLIAKEGSGFSKAVQLEIKQLINPHIFLDSQVNALNQQLARLKIRVEETEKAADLGEKLFRQGQSIDDIVSDIARLYPYELESQKPMTELLKDISPQQRIWELVEGNRYRSQYLWRPQLETLEGHKKTLLNLKDRNNLKV